MNEPALIKNLIHEIRGYKVMLDSDLAMLYEVETYRLNEAVKRNIERFPDNFMFQLTEEEWQVLRSQFVISNGSEILRSQFATSNKEEVLISQFAISKSKDKRGGRRSAPYVFTEQGVAMLSSVLRSKKAIQINIQIMNTFVNMRRWALENKELAQRLAELERYFITHCEENQADMKQLYEAISLLMDRTKPSEIGFKTDCGK